MSTDTNVGTYTMWERPSILIKGQCNIPKSISALDDGSFLGGVVCHLGKFAQIHYEHSVFTSKTVRNVTVLWPSE